MKNNLNIEDLFKNTLENAEASPLAGAWEAIQAKMGVTAATSTAATTAGLGLGKVAAIVFTALGVGLGVGYIAFKDSGKQEKQAIQQEGTVDITNEYTPEENTPITLPRDVSITDVSSVNKADKTVSIVEVKKGEETKKILVEIHHSSVQNNNASVVNQWLSPGKDKINRQEILQRIMQELERDDSAETGENVQPVKDNNIVVQTIEKDEVIAGIKTAGSDNLTYEFSNMTPASSYEWTFATDKESTTSTEANPIRTFVPGNYVISLRVTNKAGKVFKDQIFLEVKPKAEETEASEIAWKSNVFTPNGDGENDEFYLTGKNIESFSMTITNAYGKTLFMSTNINQRWDGTDKNGNRVSPGTYQLVYKAIGKDGKVHKYAGTVTLNR